MIQEIKQCRICGGKLKKVWNFGTYYISTFVKEKGDNIGKAPLKLVKCESCSLVQLAHDVSQELLYSGNYWYKSGTNPKIVNDLKDIVNKGLEEIGSQDIYWLDIGANDGTLLSFVPETCYKVAVEPAKNLKEEYLKHSHISSSSMWEDADLTSSIGKFSVITAIGMFYDSPEPNKFIANVKKHLASDGVFISQFMGLKHMLQNNDLGNICHEHLEFYNYKSIVELFERNGLEIYKVEENDINGGSYRIYARHYKYGSMDYFEYDYTFENEDELIRTFIEEIYYNKEKLLKFLEDNKGKVYGYGASTKGNTLLQFYGLDNIEGIADKNPEKHGLYTVGTNIPIVSEDEARKKADFFLVLPYSFKDVFIEREKDWLNKGGRFIFCLPQIYEQKKCS